MEMPLGKGQVARFWTAKEKNQTEDKLGSRKLDKLRNRVEKKKRLQTSSLYPCLGLRGPSLQVTCCVDNLLSKVGAQGP